MNHQLSPRVVRYRGITLLELTVTITVLLGLISILIVGTRAWKRGGDRATCILTLRNVQVAARSYQNLYGYNYGGRPYAENGTQDIARHLYEKGYLEEKLFAQATGVAKCAGGGSYSRPAIDIFPEAGVLYLNCSRSASEAHVPVSLADW